MEIRIESSRLDILEYSDVSAKWEHQIHFWIGFTYIPLTKSYRDRYFTHNNYYLYK